MLLGLIGATEGEREIGESPREIERLAFLSVCVCVCVSLLSVLLLLLSFQFLLLAVY